MVYYYCYLVAAGPVDQSPRDPEIQRSRARSDQEPKALLHRRRIPRRRVLQRRGLGDRVAVLGKGPLSRLQSPVGLDEDLAEPQVELRASAWSGPPVLQMRRTKMVTTNMVRTTAYDLVKLGPYSFCQMYWWGQCCSGHQRLARTEPAMLPVCESAFCVR